MKRSFSGIQPTGTPTLGNYLGAFRRWAQTQDERDGIYCVVDMHAITTRRDPEALRQNTFGVYAALLAAGLDPERSILFVQSHVPQHAELSWILGCYAMYGELSRMTQFKEKSAKQPDNITGGLFTYPVLMAADILLYDADEVPVGEDQKQHVELCRNIAVRFNAHHGGEIFTVPEPVMGSLGARVMSLLEPTRKMDKSDPNGGAYILVSDPRDVILAKCKKAVTDGESCVRYDPENKPGVSNLMTLYALATGKTLDDVEKEFAGKGYGVFKPAVAEALDEMLTPVRAQIAMYLDDPAELSRLMRAGADKAGVIAAQTMKRVREAVGFLDGNGTGNKER